MGLRIVVLVGALLLSVSLAANHCDVGWVRNSYVVESKTNLSLAATAGDCGM